VQTDSTFYFQWTTGPQAIKPAVFAPRENLWSAVKTAEGTVQFTELTPNVTKTALIGVRACDIAALYIQDKHFLHESGKDPYYLARRQQLLLVAVNCTRSAPTCFCTSTGDGPRVSYGYDLVLTELDDGFLIEALSQHGNELLQQLPTVTASAQQIETGNQSINEASEQQRRLPSRNLRAALFNNLEHPRWQEVAQRCLSCGNCTAVCPTCFCHSETDITALNGEHSEHLREWDSCFTPNHSYIHGITIRASTSHRYRQWLTHKLGSWHDQYGRSGCVGCGRCITWCPVGIDITEEATAICGEETA
jgi:ferredoxin